MRIGNWITGIGLVTAIRADTAWNGIVWELYGFVALIFFLLAGRTLTCIAGAHTTAEGSRDQLGRDECRTASTPGRASTCRAMSSTPQMSHRSGISIGVPKKGGWISTA